MYLQIIQGWGSQSTGAVSQQGESQGAQSGGRVKTSICRGKQCLPGDSGKGRKKIISSLNKEWSTVFQNLVDFIRKNPLHTEDRAQKPHL